MIPAPIPRAISAALGATLLITAGTASAAVVDLRTWSERGVPTAGNWVPEATSGSFVDQTVNGSPTFFVSPETLIDRTFEGTFEVRTTGDDDYIGIVFGYQSPTGNTTADTFQNFFSFAWKQGAQSGDPAGMFLAYANGTNALEFGRYESDQNRAAYVAFDNTSFGGWLDNTAYDFTLSYTTDRITMSIQSGSDSDFTTEQTVFDVGVSDFNALLGAQSQPLLTEFASGNFGFFNHSQATVRYSGITQDGDPVADAGGPYIFDASTLTLALDGSGSFDTDGGAITDHDWTTETGATLTGPTPSLAIEDSGLTSTTDTASVQLDVTDDEGTQDPDGDTAALAYANATPFVLTADAVRQADGSVDFSALFDDPDLVVNALIPGFELLSVELDVAEALDASAIGDGFLTGTAGTLTGALSYLDLVALFGGDGVFTAWANVGDGAGEVASLSFEVVVRGPGGPQPVPAPATLAVLGLGLLGVVRGRRRR
ncbi:MAG: PEP-CTERM sorting domain-containing protein [Ectothiorhodospiraceae bacterium]|nr:PEP-CTERM sorting domain-containing protein [Ectothiorhodospiraceae bacterium]